MKKFIQYTAILGAVLTVLGFGTAGAATVNGARWSQMKVWKENAQGRKQRNYRVPSGADTGKDIDSAGKSFLCQPELSVELDYGTLEIAAGEQEGILITCSDPSDFGNTVWACTEDGEMKLVIYGKRTESQKPQVQMIVPKSYEFTEMQIEQSSGTCDVSGINIQEFSAEIAAGNLTVSEVSAGDLDFEVAGGNIHYQGEVKRNADLDCAAGRIVCSGKIMGNVEAQCVAGNINLELYQQEKDFNYELEGTGGSIQLGETSLNGMVFSREMHNGAPRTMELQSAAGNIQVQFMEEEATVTEEIEQEER